MRVNKVGENAQLHLQVYIIQYNINNKYNEFVTVLINGFTFHGTKVLQGSFKKPNESNEDVTPPHKITPISIPYISFTMDSQCIKIREKSSRTIFQVNANNIPPNQKKSFDVKYISLIRRSNVKQ